MAFISAYGILLVSLILLCRNGGALAYFPPRVFNVLNYGAKADGYTDNSRAFEEAWKDACQFRGRGRVVIPAAEGVYVVNGVTLVGPCEGEMTVLIKGSVRAPTIPALFVRDRWIGFRYVDRLRVKGGGFLDGQGHSAWKLNHCATHSNCLPLPATLRFDFVTNSSISHIRSINSKKEHIVLFASNNIDISHVHLTAPESSLNTDGIRIGSSSNVKITRAVIGTGDDCISMVSGSQNIDISQVVCGPGHGISVGSLGRGVWNDNVKGINVVNCTFRHTQNGARIKTWSPSASSLAADINFQDIVMENVNNPIFIDQDYCPFCWSRKVGDSVSLVRIRNATFRNIRGTSSSKVAVSLQCSKVVPCEDVKLVDINLAYKGRGGPAVASCFNVVGTAYGEQLPSGCL